MLGVVPHACHPSIQEAEARSKTMSLGLARANYSFRIA